MNKKATRTDILSLAGLLLGLMLLGTVQAETPDMASALVKNTTDRMLQILQERRAEIDANPGLIYELVNKVIVPKFDFERITQYAMGRYWRRAKESERQALIEEFQRLLVRTYAKALLNYSGQEIRILPLRPGSGGGRILVQTMVSAPGGPTIPVNYQMHLRGGDWMVYDVIIDGVSLVTNYRTSFAQEIRRGGILGLLRTLRSRNRAGTA